MPRRKSTNKVHPSERFPTKARADGRFQKKIRGRFHYFGQNFDRKAAITEYERVKTALYEGRSPAPILDDDTMTLKDLANRYIEERELEVKAKRLSGDWHHQCKKAINRFGKKIGGGTRTIGGLGPDDFAAYGRFLTQKLGSHAFNRERESIVSMFHHAYQSDWIQRPVKLGKGFKKVAANVIRQQRSDKLVSPTHITILLAFLSAEHEQLEAMMLLAINAGFGATDCTILRWTDIDPNAIIDLRRQKTNIDRKAPLWPETVEALRDLQQRRPDDSLVFRTKYGNPWTAEAIAHQLAKHIDRLNTQRDLGPPVDVVMGDCRHTFTTYANETTDTDAWKRIMGHALPGLKGTYVETLFTPRLQKVVEHVRHRIFTNPENDLSE